MPTTRQIMYRLLVLALLIGAGSTAAWRAQDESEPPPAAAATAAEADTDAEVPPIQPPARVVIRENRHNEVAGYVDFENDDIIVIKTLNGDVQDFSKNRVVAITYLVTPEPGQLGTVRLRNGQLRRGIILEDSFQRVVVEIEGVKTTLPRESVDEVTLDPTFEERYENFKSQLEPGAHRAHFELCQWLFDERRYLLCKKELSALLREVQLPEATQLETLLDAQLFVMRGAESRQAPPAPNNATPEEPVASSGAAQAGPVDQADLLPTQILTLEDVNLIRVFELEFDRPPRVNIRPDTIRALIQGYSTSPLIPDTRQGRQAMFRAEPLRIVELMFNLRARELYPQIEVLSEPYALNQFRQSVHDRWLLNTCATSRCHGGTQAGRLFLHRANYKDARVRYTNLMILERLDIDPEWPLINYDEPLMSLIVQYGKPRDEARLPHPEVRGWDPAFTQSSRRMLQDTLVWIQSMMQPRPDYPVEYQPPVLAPAELDLPAREPGRVPR